MPTTHHVTLWGLEIFLAVVETGSIALASEQLSVSPATVSQQITNLEQSLGLKLLDRMARPIVPTPAGRIALESATRIIGDIRLMKARLTNWSISTLPSLRFAMIDEFQAGVTPDLAGELTGLYKDGSFEMWSGGTRECMDALVNRKADIVVVARMDDLDDSFEQHDLLREQFILVTSPGLLDNCNAPIDRLRQSRLVRYARYLPIARMIEAHLARVRLKNPHTLRFDSSYSVFSALQQAPGWALSTPLGYAQCQRFHGTLDVMKPPFPGLSRTITLLARKDELGRLPAEFATRLRRLMQKHYFTQGPLNSTIGNWLHMVGSEDRDGHSESDLRES